MSGFRNYFFRLKKRASRLCLTKSACPLTQLPFGAKARVLDIIGSCEQRQRLCALGLTPGTPVEMCGEFPGLRRLLVRGVSLALDSELAGRVVCQEDKHV